MTDKEYIDLGKLINLARDTGVLYAGKESYKLFSGLPVGDNGLLLTHGARCIEIIENAWLEPNAICAIKSPRN
jgi:hypothetical protein